MVAPGNNVRKEILSATAADGSMMKLVVLHDGCYAITRGGYVVAQTHDGETMDVMIEQMLRMAGEQKDGGAAGAPGGSGW
jgi:hypothetical protein